MRSTKPELARLAVLAALVLVAAAPAHATFTFSDTFDTPYFGSVSGSFEWTGSAFTGDLSITTSGGNSPFGSMLTYTSSAGSQCVPGLISANDLACQSGTTVGVDRTISITWLVGNTFEIDEHSLPFTDPNFEGGSDIIRTAQFEATNTQPGVVPEPGSVVLMVTGLAGLGLWRSRRRAA